MTSYELIRLLEELKSALSSPEPVAMITRTSQYYPLLVSAIAEFAGLDPNKAPGKINDLHSSLMGMITSLRDSQPASNFVALDKWLTQLTDLNTRISPEFVPLGQLIGTAQQFNQEYEEFVRAYSRPAVVEMVITANDALNQILSVRNLVAAIIYAIEPKYEIPENYEELSLLFFSPPQSVKELAIKLSAVQDLYSELCRLLSISDNQYSLRIVKVEAGSLWLKLFGESRVIQMMTQFLEKAVSYLHRNYTVEGKISAIPKNAEAVDSLLNLSKKLKEHGIDTSELNENIKQTAVVVSQQLNRVLSGETSVEINGRDYSLGNERNERFLKQPRSLFLTSGDEPQVVENEEDGKSVE